MKALISLLLSTISVGLLLSGCGPGPSPSQTEAQVTAGPASSVGDEALLEDDVASTPTAQRIDLKSAAFDFGEPIPEKHSCDGEDISPALEWSEPPEGTQSFALIFDDPDAVKVAGHTWIHWILLNIPAESRALPESIPAEPKLPDGSIHGHNSWKRFGYGGPCPPQGTHVYSFRLYALDRQLDFGSGATADEVMREIEGHVLGQAELKGSYTR